jgi:hypothetical protein
MVTKIKKVGVFVALVLVYLLIGSLIVRIGHLAQPGIRSSGVGSAPDVTSVHNVNGKATQSTLTNNSADASYQLDSRPKMNRGTATARAHSVAMSSKGGGGTVAVITFLILFGLWCFHGLFTAAKAPSHQ